MFRIKFSGHSCFLNITARVLQAWCESAFAGEFSGSIPSVDGVDLLGDTVCRNADTLIFNLIISQVTKKFFNSIWLSNF